MFSWSTQASQISSEITEFKLFPWVALRHDSDTDDTEAEKPVELAFGVSANQPTSASNDVSRAWHGIVHHVQLSIAQRFVELQRSGQMVFDTEEEFHGLQQAVTKAIEWAKDHRGQRDIVGALNADEITRWAGTFDDHNEYLPCHVSPPPSDGVSSLDSATATGPQMIGFKETFPSEVEHGPSRLDAQWIPRILRGHSNAPSMSMFARFVYEGDGDIVREPHMTTCPGSHINLDIDGLRERAKAMSRAAWENAEWAAEESGLLKDFKGHFDSAEFHDVLREQHKDIFKRPFDPTRVATMEH